MKTMNMETRHLEPARKELSRAAESFAVLRKIGRFGPFDQFEKAWKDLLHRIELVWNKVEAGCKSDQAWRHLRGRYIALRRGDPLLQYLRHARNVDQHTIQEGIEDEPIQRIEVGLAPDDPNFGRLIELNENGDPVFYQGERLLFTWNEPKRFLLPVVDRNVEYTPPLEHLGRPLDRTDPIGVAEAGLHFYQELFTTVELECFR